MERDKGRGGVGRRVRELLVVVGDEAFEEIRVGRRHRPDTGQRQLVDEPALHRAVQPLAAPASLGRVGGNVLDAELRPRAPDLRQPRAVDAAPRLGRVKRPAGAVGVERHRQAVLAEHRAPGRHHRVGGFRGPELRVQQALGRIVEHGDEGLLRVGAVAQPGMSTAVEVQQLADARPGLAPSAMPPTGAALTHQAGLLQRQLHEAIGQRHPMIAPSEAVEVAHVPAGKALSVQPHDMLHLERRRLARRRQLPPIVQRHGAAGFKPRPPAPHTAGLNAQHVRCLQPRQGATQCPHDDFLPFHGPLHRGRGQHHRHLLGCRWLYCAPRAKRTFHLFSGADRSCAPYTLGLAA